MKKIASILSAAAAAPFVGCIPLLLLCLMPVQGVAQTYSVLENFDKSVGWGPRGTLLVSGGTVYGTAAYGVGFYLYNYGSVFKLDVNGLDFSVLKVWGSSETADSTPYSGLVLSGSTLYGTTFGYSPHGAVFKVETNGSGYAVLKHFAGNDGSGPLEGLVLSGATLYGTTSSGGTGGGGTVFRINRDGSGFSLLKQFGTDGWPHAPLVLSGTILYGTTQNGGDFNYGTVFQINTDGTGYAVLKEFGGPDGRYPAAGLVLAGETLYGTTFQGGTYNLGPLDRGTVFKLNTDGTGFAVLKQFTGVDGCYPESRVLVSGSRIYGVTSAGALGWEGEISGHGVLFEINTNGTGFVVLKQFTGNDGSGPEGGLAFSGNALYGTTVGGGAYGGGPVFRLDLPDAPQVTLPPLEQVAVIGTTATFTVNDLGQYPLSYQWFFQGTNLISGASDSVLQLTNVQFSQAGPYSVLITNSFGAVTSSPGFLRVIAGSTLTNCAEADLRALMRAGGVVTVNCDGVITLGSTLTVAKNVTLDATSHHLILSGSNAVRVLYVNTNVSFTAINLTIANGLEPEGAGIYNDGGTLNLLKVCCRDNFGTNLEANYYGTGELRGAAIFNHSGTVNATNCSFTGNTLRSSGQRTAHGGAIFNDSGQLHLQNCLFLSNSAFAGAWTGYVAQTNGLEGSGGAGAVHNEASLSASDCAFVQNAVGGGAGVLGNRTQPTIIGGPARGGAICNLGGMVIERSLFASNAIVGGAGGNGFDPGFGSPNPGGTGATGGIACGGALFVGGPSSLINCTLTGNEARGGPGGNGGRGGVVINGGTGEFVYYPGGQGGNGGTGSGAVYDATGALRLTNCTMASNSSFGGAGGVGGMGNPRGLPGSGGIAAGALQTTNGTSVNCLLAGNSPTNCTGRIVDAGHNLSSDASCAFTNSGSLNNTDAKLGVLTNNGGPTFTMALLPDSPAIDAGDTSLAPATDQRGFPRPAGLAADIGAFEYGSMLPVLAISRTGATGLDITAFGNVGQSCRLLTSTDLWNWVPIATNQISGDGTVMFHDTCDPGVTCRFYRLVMP